MATQASPVGSSSNLTALLECAQQQPAGERGLAYTDFTNDGNWLEYRDDFDPANIPLTENPVIGGGAVSTVNDYSKVLLMHLHGVIMKIRMKKNLKILKPYSKHTNQRSPLLSLNPSYRARVVCASIPPFI